MKILVTEMPLTKSECPFSKEYITRLWNHATGRRCEVTMYECVVNKSDCDLKNSACSCLKVLKMEE